VLFLSLLVGGPAFLVGNILAVIALRSKSASAVRLGKWALRLMWAFVALFFLLGLAAYISEKISGR
jgi:hypothetical protein